MALSAKVGFFTATTGAQAVTGVGFLPKIVLFFTEGNVGRFFAGGGGWGFGAGVSSSLRFASCFRTTASVSPTVITRAWDNTKCSQYYDAGLVLNTVGLTSLDADGFTLSNAITTAATVYYLALGGSDLTNAFVGSFADPAATGTKAVTGVGFTPTCVLFFQSAANTATTGSGSGSGHPHIGAASGSGARQQWAYGARHRNGQSATEVCSVMRFGKCICRVDTSGSDTITTSASLTSFDADGFTLNYDVRNAQNVEYFVALKGATIVAGQAWASGITQPLNVNGLGTRPTAVVMVASRAQDFDGVFTDVACFGASMSIGAAVDPVLSGAATGAIALDDPDNVAAQAGMSYQSAQDLVTLWSDAADQQADPYSILYRAQLKGTMPDGFRVDEIDFDREYPFGYVAFGPTTATLAAGPPNAGVTAGLQARSGRARSGATRSDAVQPVVKVTISGTARAILRETLEITKSLSGEADTARFTLESASYTPTKGEEILIGLGSIENAVFAGHVQKVTRRWPTGGASPITTFFDLECIDYTWVVNSKIVTRAYGYGAGLTGIVRDVIERFAPSGFTAPFVEAGLPAVDGVLADQGFGIAEFLDDLAKRGSALGDGAPIHWYFDARKRLHFFRYADPEARQEPAPITSASSDDRTDGLAFTDDLTQIRTRILVDYAGTVVAQSETVGATTLLVEDASLIPAAPGTVYINGQQITYDGITNDAVGDQDLLTGIPTGSDDGAITVAIPVGAPVRNRLQVDDTTAQAVLAALMGTDGIVEHYLQDDGWDAGGALSAALAEVAVFKSALTSLSVNSYDKFALPGRRLVFALGTPFNLTGTYIIQTVTMSAFEAGAIAGGRVTYEPHKALGVDLLRRYDLQILIRRIE